MRNQVHIESALFQCIADPEATQADVATVYRLALSTPGRFPWSEINRAIMSRWSKAGLIHVKDLAWRNSGV